MTVCFSVTVFLWLLQETALGAVPPSTATIAFIPLLRDTQSLQAIQSAINSVNNDTTLLASTKLRLSNAVYTTDKRALQYAANLTSQNTLAIFTDDLPKPSHKLLGGLLKIPLVPARAQNLAGSKTNVLSLAVRREDVNQAIYDVLRHNLWTTVLILFDVSWRDQTSHFLSILPPEVKREAIELILDQEGKLLDQAKVKMRQQNNKLVEVIALFCDAKFVTIVMEEVHCSCSRTIERAHNWILADMLPSFDLVVESSQIVVAFTPHIATNVHSQRLMTDLKAQSMNDIKNHSYLLYDAVFTFAHALDKVIASGQWISQTNVINIEESKNGLNILNEMRKVQAVGATGAISFNTTGGRQHVVLDVMNLQSNKFRKIGNWSSAGFVATSNAEQNKNTRVVVPLNKLNRKLTVMLIVDPPFAMSITDQNTGKKKLIGYSVDLLEALAGILSFNYQMMESPDGEYGGKQTDGTYNGIVGELIKGNADMSTAPLTITSDRHQQIQFSKPFMQFTMDLVLLKPHEGGTDILAFMMPYSVLVWLMTLACLSFMTFMLTMINHFSPFGHKHGDNDGTGVEFNIFNSFWFSLSSMLCQGGDNTPKSLSGRVLVGCFWFCILIWVSTYTANLAAFFTFRQSGHTVNSLQDIIEDGNTVHILKDTALEETFKTAKYETYRKLYQRMLEQDSILSGGESAYDKVRKSEKSVYIEEHPYAAYVVESYPCDLTTVKGFMGVKGYGISMTKGFPYGTNISLALLRLQETGVMDELKRKWWDYRSQCSDHSIGQVSKTERLGLGNMAGVYLVIAAGCVLAIISMLIEVVWSKKGNAIKSAFNGLLPKKREKPTPVKPFDASK